MDNAYVDNLTYGASELAKRSSVSLSLSGWPDGNLLEPAFNEGFVKFGKVCGL
jgi:hypothetical protein